MNVAVFGGSFNPPHIAHVLAVTVVLSTHAIDRVLVIPTFQHPFAKSLAPYDDRVAMCEQAMAFLPGIEISRVEQELGGESRTLRTIEHLKATHPEYRLRLVVGADVLVDAHKWHGFDAIVALAPLIVLGRVGVEGTSAPAPVLPAISSTEVRSRLASLLASSASSESDPVLDALVPRRVLAYARERRLYGA